MNVDQSVAFATVFPPTARFADRLLGSCAKGALLALPVALSFGVLAPAEAQTSLSGSYNRTVDLNPTNYPNGSPFTITNNSTIAATTGDGVYSNNLITLTNAGMITGTPGNGINLQLGGSVTNTSSGIISGRNDGILIMNGTGAVSNAGSISGAGPAGIYLGKGGSVTNGGVTANISGGILIGGGSGTVTLTTPLIFTPHRKYRRTAGLQRSLPRSARATVSAAGLAWWG